MIEEPANDVLLHLRGNQQSRRGLQVAFVRPGAPLRVSEAEVAGPGVGEVLVRMTMAGVCGTDAHRLRGDLGAPPAPVNFGHEGVGTIEAIGAGASRDRSGAQLAVGDSVYWSPVGPCGGCSSCRDGRPCDLTQWPPAAGTPNGATFQEFATIGATAPLYRIPEDTPAESVIAFGCALPTALGGLSRLGSVSDQVVVIQGAGPVGLACTMLASLGGAKRVITIGDTALRLAAASRLGATDTIPLTSTTADERLETVRQLTKGLGADVVIEAAGHASAFPEGFQLLGHGARFLILGLYSGAASAPIDPVRINNLNLQIIGSLGSDTANNRRTVEIASAHGERFDFAALITHRFPLESTEAAIRTMASGASIKAVVQPRFQLQRVN